MGICMAKIYHSEFVTQWLKQQVVCGTRMAVNEWAGCSICLVQGFYLCIVHWNALRASPGYCNVSHPSIHKRVVLLADYFEMNSVWNTDQVLQEERRITHDINTAVLMWWNSSEHDKQILIYRTRLQTTAHKYVYLLFTWKSLFTLLWYTDSNFEKQLGLL